MDVSKNGGTQQPLVFLLKMIIYFGVFWGYHHLRMFPKIVGNYPQIIHFNRVFQLFSPSILGETPLFLETPIYEHLASTWMNGVVAGSCIK